MLFWENMRLAFSAIRVNKMRSFLTMLGMIIGISSVISIVSIGDTMRSVVASEYDNIGLGRAMIYIRTSDGYYDSGDLFSLDDIERVEKLFADNIDYISAQTQEKATVRQGRLNETIYLMGVKGGYSDVQKVDIIAGRMLTDSDNNSKRNNIVLEKETAKTLFGKSDIVGQQIKVIISRGQEQDMVEMMVVGIYQNSQSVFSKLMGGSSTAVAYVPENILLNNDASIWQLDFYVSDTTNLTTFQTQITNYISKIKNKEKEEIIYYSAKEDMAAMDGMLSGMSAAVGAIAAISLLVGGIGIMNIMLVSVTERTREIGIRKALGARTIDIMVQFLIESAIISAAGGVIGTALGAGIVTAGGMIMGISVVIKPNIVGVAVMFSAVVGIFFGLYPAGKAAKADPITALRYE